MGRAKVLLYPQIEDKLQALGYRIKLARLRRKLPVELVAERAKVSRSTVWAVEHGSQSVSMGGYAAVLMAIGMIQDLDKVAGDDVLGRTLQDMGLPTRERAPKGEKTHE